MYMTYESSISVQCIHAVNRCNFTLLHPQLMADYHLMIISPDYSYNYSVGMSVNLSCHANDSFELIPTSPTLTCGEDGQWSPNLSQIMCVKGMIYSCPYMRTVFSFCHYHGN